MTTDRVKKIKRLHNKVKRAIRQSLADCIEIGKELHEQKAELEHSEWGPWFEEHLLEMGFCRATANNYMRLYTNRDKLQLLNVSNSGPTYDLLNSPSQERKCKKKDRPK